ncbi:MAG: VWA domain-containing protein [Pirellulales bacterium]|nr:VWA domain-containing protein [Pirellulales bacterium]
MLPYSLSFDSPWYLLLLLLVPMLWALSFRRMGVLGPWRRWFALGLRTLVMVLLIFALAGAQMVHTSDRLTVIYLLDQSLSIPAEQRRAMILYVNAAIEKHREHLDRAGVIVFGRDAAIEIPPFDDDVKMPLLVESLLDPEYTNLAGAMRLAQASFPEDAARRIVVVSDGNENIGDAVEQARGLTGAGVGIDVVPVRFDRQGEVIVERMTIPNDIRRGQPFDMKVVVTNTKTPSGSDSGAVGGRLVIRQRAGDQARVISDEAVTLPPGKRVYSVRQQIDAPSFYTYEAEFVPQRPEDDTMRQNNRATAFTHIRGKGQVLLIEDFQGPGQFERLVQALRLRNLEVTLRASDQPFTGLAELQQFDTVLLGNVPREHFTDEQIQMLVRNTQQMGAGLVMLGGPNSFGAGGWTNTELEKAMPVDFQIKSAKVVPRGALVMMMHACEIPEGNHWQKVIAREALKALGERDYCGVVHWMGQEQWLWGGLKVVGGNRQQMLARMDRMTPGDMPDFDPAMVMAQKEFSRIQDAAIKHMIIISDGDPSPPSRGVIAALVNQQVTVSTVAVGAHGPAESRVLDNLAKATGGKFYKVNNPKALPRIFQREARRVAQPLIFESKNGVKPTIRFPHEMLSGIEDPLEPIHGFVMTTVKENPLVEVSLVSPQPVNEKNATILASWTYGLGKSVAFTSDCGARWASGWTGWENYDKFFGQMVGWSMRPVGEEGNFVVATDVEDGQVRLVVTALDKDDEFLNFLDMSGTVVGPNLEPVPMKMQQTAPGRYEGAFPARDSGSYFLMVNPGGGKAPIRTGVSVPYSDEFRAKPTNLGLLEQLAQLAPEGGTAGKLVPSPRQPSEIEPMLAVNSFRHDLPKATSSQDIWFHLVFLASCLFFFDVFVRRVQVSFAWVPSLAGRVRDRILRRTPEAPKPEMIERLRSRKAAVSQEVDQLRAAARFETSEQSAATAAEVEELKPSAAPRPAPPRQEPGLAPGQEEESYTARLLKAKKKAWKDRENRQE